MRKEAADEGTDIALECVTLTTADVGGRCTPLSVIVLTLPRGWGGCACAEWIPVLPAGLRIGIACATVVIPCFGLSFFVTCRAMHVDAGIGSAEDIDGRMLFRLRRGAAGGALLHLAVGAAVTCIWWSSGRTNWCTGACRAAIGDFV